MRRGYTLMELVTVVGMLCIILCTVLHFLFCLSNIYQLTKCDFKPPYKAEVLRIGGVFVPLAPVVLTFVSNESLGEPRQGTVSIASASASVVVPVASKTQSVDIRKVD